MELKGINDGIEALGKKMDSSKDEHARAIGEVKSMTESKFDEAAKSIKGVEAKHSEFELDVNKKFADMGKTGAEILAEMQAIKAKQRFTPISGNPEAKEAGDVIRTLIAENYDSIKGLKKGISLQMEEKAGTITIGSVSSTGTAVNSPYQYIPGIVTRPTRRIQIRDLCTVVQTNVGTVIYYRQQPGTIGTGSFGFQAGQGNVKAQLDYTLQQVILPLDYLAGFAKVARQMVDDLPGFQDFITGQLLEDYRRSESAAFIPQLIANSTAFTPGGASVTAEFIVKAIADLQGKDWSPNGIVTDAPTWAKLMNTKPNDYSLPGGGSAINIGLDGTVYFLGIPVVVQNNMPASQIVVGDFSKADIFQAAGLRMDMFEQDVDNVQRNVVTVRVEARVGFGVLRTDAFDTFAAGTA